MENSPNELLWFIVGLALLLAEFVTPGFIIVFFGLGAWVISLLLWLGVDISFTTQLFVFLVVSIVLLGVFRKYVKEYSQGKVTKADSLHPIGDVKGEKAVVISDIQPNNVGGKVEFNGTLWNAESTVAISQGTTVEIVERNNLILTVKPIS